MAIKSAGTDGWRGIIGKDFTFDTVQLVSQAIAEYLKATNNSHKGIIVGYDTRFLSKEFARQSAAVMAANDIPVWLCEEPTPTPVISYSVADRGTAGAIIVTASHNPPEYNGIKFKGEYGGSALPQMEQEIGRYLDKIAQLRNLLKSISFSKAVNKGLITHFNPAERYMEHLKPLVNFDAIANSNLKIVVDPIHGTGRGYLSALLTGTTCEVIEIRANRDPLFGGIRPDPIMKNLTYLTEVVKDTNAAVGFGFDGDVDRIGAVDAKFGYINPHQIFSLMLHHLASRSDGYKSVAKTFSTSQMIDKIAEKYRLKVYETPIGFKYICELMIEDEVAIGGEESGGIALKAHVPECDGILCALILLEIMATNKKTLGECLEDLMSEIGYYYYDRVDLEIDEERKQKLVATYTYPPSRVGEFKVKSAKKLDGLKLFFDDGSWMLIRPSGTEPLVRIYAEADAQEKVQQILKEGRKLIDSR